MFVLLFIIIHIFLDLQNCCRCKNSKLWVEIKHINAEQHLPDVSWHPDHISGPRVRTRGVVIRWCCCAYLCAPVISADLCIYLIFSILLVCWLTVDGSLASAGRADPKLYPDSGASLSWALYFLSSLQGNSVTGKWAVWLRRREISSRRRCLCLPSSYGTCGCWDEGPVFSRSMTTWSKNTARTS